MSASTQPEIALPPAAPVTGDALGADAARVALTENDVEGAEGVHDNDNGDASPVTAGAQPTAHPGDSADDAASTKSAPREREGRTNAKAPKLGTLVRRSKKELAEHVIRESAARSDAEARLDALTRDTVAAETMGADVIDASVRDMVGDVVDLADGAAQLTVREKFAAAVALDAEERDKLVRLGARVVQIRARSAVAKAAPEIALAVALVSIVLGKVIAYKLAAKDAAAPVKRA